MLAYLCFVACVFVCLIDSIEQPFTNPAIAALGRSNSTVRPGLSRQNSGVRPLMGSPVVTQGKTLAVGGHEGRVDIGGFQPPPFKLETLAACQLITFIYESKVRCSLLFYGYLGGVYCILYSILYTTIQAILIIYYTLLYYTRSGMRWRTTTRSTFPSACPC